MEIYSDKNGIVIEANCDRQPLTKVHYYIRRGRNYLCATSVDKTVVEDINSPISLLTAVENTLKDNLDEFHQELLSIVQNAKSQFIPTLAS